MTVTLTKSDREKLYEEVWATPMTKLAPQYGVTDQGLRKACLKLQVPVPAAGYWAKLAAGKKVAKPPLLPFSERKEELRTARVARDHRERQLAEREAWSAPPNPVETEVPIRLHRLLAPVRAKAAEGAKHAERLKRVFDWEEKRPGQRHPDRDRHSLYGSWRYFADKGQLAIDSHKKCVIRVSVLHWQRALSLLNMVITLAVEKGLAVSMVGERERLKIKRGKAYVHVRVAERFDSTVRKEYRSWNKTWEAVKVAVPTGRLSIFVEGAGLAQTVVGDKPGAFLETRIAEVWNALSLRLESTAQKQAEWEQWEKDRQQAARLREEQEVKERERLRLEAEESKRRDRLLEEVETWRRADNLRSYVAELDRRIAEGGHAAPDYAAWRAWALSVAAGLDPSGRRAELSLQDP